ncbi:MAG: dihydroxyacetone kinase transcriptional activator DhaS [Cellulosilyticaceae bacterium]
MSDSIITKRAIAQALKSLILTKPFEKISISDLTSACGLGRQTFYYHFQDKYELLTWIYYNEGFSPVVDAITFENWDQKILLLLEIMKKEQFFYCHTITADSHYFMDYLLEITSTLFTEAIEALDTAHKLDASQKQFFSQFYAYGICGVILSWVTSHMKQSPQEIAINLKKLAHHSEHLGYTFYLKDHELPLN